MFRVRGLGASGRVLRFSRTVPPPLPPPSMSEHAHVSPGASDDSSDGRPSTVLARLKARARNTDIADRLARIDAEYVRRNARQITGGDLDAVVERAGAIEKRFRKNETLQRLRTDGRLLLGLVRDARRRHYREIPVWTLSAVGFTLLYVLNPFDLVPDALPVLGLLDDAAVVSACLSLVEQDLYDYRAWKRENEGNKAASPSNLITS